MEKTPVETSVESLLQQMARLLQEHDEANWADSLERLAGEYRESPDVARAKIRSLYGGMGSFNDIVLYGSDGLPLRPENNTLDDLRTRLYAACR